MCHDFLYDEFTYLGLYRMAQILADSIFKCNFLIDSCILIPISFYVICKGFNWRVHISLGDNLLGAEMQHAYIHII